MAETRGFEPPIPFRENLISSEDYRVVLSLIYASLTSLQSNNLIQIRPSKANSWAKHGQNLGYRVPLLQGGLLYTLSDLVGNVHIGQELSVKPFSLLSTNRVPFTVVLKEDLLALKYNARSAGLQ